MKRVMGMRWEVARAHNTWWEEREQDHGVIGQGTVFLGLFGIGRVLLLTKVSTTSGLFEISLPTTHHDPSLNSHFYFVLKRLSLSEYAFILSSFNTQHLNFATLVLISFLLLVLPYFL